MESTAGERKDTVTQGGPPGKRKIKVRICGILNWAFENGTIFLMF